MTNKSNNQGRAFEFACLTTLEKNIKKHRPVQIVKNSSYDAARKAWAQIDEKLQQKLCAAAQAAVKGLFDLEVLILEPGDDVLELLIQTDQKGIEGDVRDVLIVRRDLHWEIGLSLKHNHAAVKHSRLSRQLDFGQQWYGVPCSEQYWHDITPVFSILDQAIQDDLRWSELPDKAQQIYVPLLQAFMDELRRCYQKHTDLPAKITEYLLGKYDFYKVISQDTKRLTEIQAFNLHGTLNQSGQDNKSKIHVPQAALPTQLIHMDFRAGSQTTIELYFDKGWQFSLRIHSASTKVESSLKFDVQLVGQPAEIVSLNCQWL